ncbi:DUF1642 domain-containing protein [Streptococcus suis]|uniref:DUF1642 domain-containing protein n=1 Tax=Streptococcus suis TaxID=1307 RepID=UPI00069B1500|nr:DUF1642 domain-containing protein [Streptococcus suis]NQG33718.1 DUF1642 domain-containing protein [Streptococcus suis]NQM89620.1 DUF1642 domain-containing protein [Streptococcus suis]NQM95577.1 DUF1642 domain-containing protein [Streptococcus suis]NQN06710.1 DUF1642 domain-containing protein [Streptococcus suis]NQN08905.1 DUF1642 domain-containing protein [Streptococcus suis]
MNKQELEKQAEALYTDVRSFLDNTFELIDQIDEPQRVVVSQVAVEYYNTFKDYGYSLVELLGDFCYQSTREKFPRLNELETWLYGNDEATNRQRELALATLILNGPDAVEIEQEKLYTVEIPDPNSYCDYRYLSRNDNGICLDASNDTKWKQKKRNQFTESEIKEDFEWAWQFAKEVE